mmetsp:Transcript_18750/g.35395  ORF Transcript_18750/g.35395 Transcript_18750/m.35395 type:complete len:579 (-) Transcript_18750:341-2077(-)
MVCFYAANGAGSTSLDARICVDQGVSNVSLMESSVDFATEASLNDVTEIIHIVIFGVLVFWMQAGFSMLEAGSVREKNTHSILFKNLLDASIGAICFWLVGYSFAFGTGTKTNGFIGSGNYALTDYEEDGDDFHLWFFHWAFSGAAATIVSGSIAERCRLEAYVLFTIFMTTFIYPVVVHWVWSEDGWLSTFRDDPVLKQNGMIDFAGAAVVHTVGGVSGLVGTLILRPRVGFLSDDEEVRAKLKGSSDLLCSLGVSILWMGWYGFNIGSSFFTGQPGINALTVGARVAVTTTIAAASGAIICMIYSRMFQSLYLLKFCLNGVLAGLVSITGSAALVEVWGALCIGVLGGLVYIGSSMLLIYLGIDDPLDAFPVHGACGIWGTLAVGIFSTSANMKRVYGIDNDALSTGNQILNQLIGSLVICSWSAVMSGIVFYPLRFAGLLRVSQVDEEVGLDVAEHGVEIRAACPECGRNNGSFTNTGTGRAGKNPFQESKSKVARRSEAQEEGKNEQQKDNNEIARSPRKFTRHGSHKDTALEAETQPSIRGISQPSIDLQDMSESRTQPKEHRLRGVLEDPLT